MSKKEMTLKEFEYQYALGSMSNGALRKLAEETTSKEILTILSTNKDWNIKMRVSRNKHTPKEISEELLSHEEIVIRILCIPDPEDIKGNKNVGINPPLPQELINRIEDEDKKPEA